MDEESQGPEGEAGGPGQEECDGPAVERGATIQEGAAVTAAGGSGEAAEVARNESKKLPVLESLRNKHMRRDERDTEAVPGMILPPPGGWNEVGSRNQDDWKRPILAPSEAEKHEIEAFNEKLRSAGPGDFISLPEGIDPKDIAPHGTLKNYWGVQFDDNCWMSRGASSLHCSDPADSYWTECLKAAEGYAKKYNGKVCRMEMKIVVPG